MSEPIDPATIAANDQIGAMVNEVVMQLLGTVAMVRYLVEHKEHDAASTTVNDFMELARQVPENLSVAVMFDLCKRLIDSGAVGVQVEDQRP